MQEYPTMQIFYTKFALIATFVNRTAQYTKNTKHDTPFPVLIQQKWLQGS